MKKDRVSVGNQPLLSGITERSNRYLSIICTYLVFVVCAQIFIIYNLWNQTNILKQKSNSTEVLCEHNVVSQCCYFVSSNITSDINAHQIWKRQVKSFGTCPPGCVRRKRRRFGFTGKRPDETTISTPTPVQYSKSDFGPTGPVEESDISREMGFHGYMGEPGAYGIPGRRREAGGSGPPGIRGQPGNSGVIGRSGEPGELGMPGERGEPGAPGRPGGRGSPGMPGLRGTPGMPGLRGTPGISGSPGLSGAPGAPGLSGEPGRPGIPGTRGSPGSSGIPGLHGNRGSPGTIGQPGLQGPPGSRGPPGDFYSYPQESLQLKNRGDQGNPLEDPTAYEVATKPQKNETQVSEVLKELRLLDRPECKDEVDHKALMHDLKNRGKVSFMILVDLEDSVYCIVHA